MWRLPVQTADNNRKEDARLLYMMELASCSCPRSGCSAIIYGGQEHDFFAVDVSCNCPLNSFWENVYENDF